MTAFTHAEIFEKIIECDGDKPSMIKVLEKYADYVFMTTLFYLYDPNIEFNITWIPEYKPSTQPYGNQFVLFNKVYAKFNHFVLGKNTDYSEEVREKMLKRFLETLHANDAKIVEMIIKRKKPDIKGFDEEFVREVFPNLLTKQKKDSLREFFI